jgi:valyl-tRNA synthetase
MAYLQGGIVSARNQRAELKIAQKEKVPAEVLILDEQEHRLVEDNRDTIMRLASLSELREASHPMAGSGGAAVAVSADLDIRVLYEAKVDRTAEIARIRKEVERLEKDVESKKKRLADESFRSKAPAEIVQDLETKFAERQAEHQKLLDRLKQLE